METLNINSKNLGYYKTTSLSTVGELESCDSIALYLTNKSENLSLNKLSNVNSLDELLPNNLYLILEKEDHGIFVYDRLNILDNPLVRGDNNLGFNTIIYINYSGKPIGYTEFTYVQGIIPEKLTIELKFNVNTDSSESRGINLIDNLSSTLTSGRIDNKLKTLLNTDKLYGLTTLDRVNKELDKAINIYPRYTKSVKELLNNSEMSSFLDFGICSSEGLYKLNLIKEMTIAEDLKNHQLGYYKGEIVLYSWKEESGKYYYSLHSLSRRDKFGNPICYTNTTTGTKEIKNYLKDTIAGIRYFSGKYISVTIKSSSSGKGEFYAVYNIDTDDWVQLDSENHVMDLWGIDSRIIELPKADKLSANTFIKFCPDIINTFLDVKNYTYKPFEVIKKIGEWYVLNQTRQSDNTRKIGYFRIYTNMTKTIILSNTPEYLDEDPIIINNNILALKTNAKYNISNNIDIIDYLNYYTYFVGNGIHYSENALLVLSKLYIEDSNSNVKIYHPDRSSKPLTPEEIKTKQDVINYYNILLTTGNYNYLKILLKRGIVPNVYTDVKTVVIPGTGNKPTTEFKNKYGTDLLIDHIGSKFTESYISGFRRYCCPDDLLVPELIGSINGLIYYKTKDNKIKLL